jgi:predicted nucleic acid-binding protein
MAERRGRIAEAGVQDALRLLRSLPLVAGEPPSLTQSERILHLMRAHHLTAYDATYLELACRLGLPLATKDRDLLVAAPTTGATLFAPAP